MNVEISRLRRASASDGDAIADVFIRARAATMDFLPRMHSADPTRTWMKDVVGREEVWVAEVNGRIVGFAVLSADQLEHLYVLPERQGSGVGSALLDRAKQERPAGFRLWVFQRNEQARSFYEWHGLRLVSLTDGSQNEEREPDALYEWRPA